LDAPVVAGPGTRDPGCVVHAISCVSRPVLSHSRSDDMMCTWSGPTERTSEAWARPAPCTGRATNPAPGRFGPARGRGGYTGPVGTGPKRLVSLKLTVPSQLYARKGKGLHFKHLWLCATAVRLQYTTYIVEQSCYREHHLSGVRSEPTFTPWATAELRPDRHRSDLPCGT
jgi:hypothetical protein